MRECKCKTHNGNRLLDDSMFSKNKHKPDGIETRCKTCCAVGQKRWREENREMREMLREENQKYYRGYYEANKEKVLEGNKQRRLAGSRKNSESREYRLATYTKRWLSYVKTRARKNGVEFSLVVEDIVIPEVCPVLGIPLIPCARNHGERGPTEPNSPTIDRIDNSKGYTKDNVVVVSWRANRLKNNATLEEMRMISDFYSQFFTT